MVKIQPLLDGPRAGLTEAFVQSLLQSQSAIQITYGATGLDASFSQIADLPLQTGSSVTCSVTDTTQRSCSLNMDSDVTSTGWSYLSGYIRPHMILTDVNTGLGAMFHLGVYTLTTPTRTLGTTPTVLNFQGFDLTYLLRQEIGDSFEVSAGSDPAQAAALVIGLAIPGAVVNITPSGSSLPSQLTWVFDPAQPTLYIDIINTLLNSIGYRQIWVDWEGAFQIEPFIDLQATDAEWDFDTLDPDNIVAEGGTQDVDIYDVPNWWRFVIADLTASPVEGVSMFTWQDSSGTNPGSSANRGRTQRKIVAVTATSYADLLDFAQKTIVADLAPSETFTVKTQPFPLAWHMDVIRYSDTSLNDALPANGGPVRRVLATGWSLPLDGQSDMDWTWQTISDQNSAIGLTGSS